MRGWGRLSVNTYGLSGSGFRDGIGNLRIKKISPLVALPALGIECTEHMYYSSEPTVQRIRSRLKLPVWKSIYWDLPPPLLFLELFSASLVFIGKFCFSLALRLSRPTDQVGWEVIFWIQTFMGEKAILGWKGDRGGEGRKEWGKGRSDVVNRFFFS